MHFAGYVVQSASENDIDVSQLTLDGKIQVAQMALKAILDLATHRVLAVMENQVNQTEFEKTLRALNSQLHLWIESLLALNEPRHFQTAQSISRSIFELLIDIKLLMDNPTDLPKFQAFVKVERFRAAKSLVNFLNEHPDVDQAEYASEIGHVANPKNEARIESLRRKYWGIIAEGKRGAGNPVSPKHWAQENWHPSTVADRAKSNGVQYEEIYRANYARQSWYSHSGSVGIYGLSRESLTYAFGIAILHSLKLFAMATELFATHFRLFDASPELRQKLENASEGADVSIHRFLQTQVNDEADNKKSLE